MLNLAAIDKVLKEVYVEGMRRQMNSTNILLSQVKRDSEVVDGSGKFAVIPLMLGFSEGVGARNEREDLPSALSSRYERITVPIRTNYGVIEITGHAIRGSQNNVGSYIRAVDSEMKNMAEGMRRDVSRQLYGDGTGRLAAVTALPGGSVIEVDDVSPFRISQAIDIYNPAGTALRVSATITAITVATRRITLSVAPTGVVANDILIRRGAINREMMGLAGIVGTGNYILDPAVVPEWVSSVTTVPSGYSLLVEMQKAYTACEKNNASPNLILTSFTQRDAYANSLTTARRIVNSLDLEWGFKGLDFNGKALVADDQCPEGLMYFLNTNNLVLAQASDFDWGDEDGSILTKVPLKDAYTAFIYFAANLATDRRNAHALLRGL